jgi:hypothetical protein
MAKEILRAISIRQPWAWLIIHGGKDVENRTWPTRVRGRVFVHAAKGLTRAEYEEVNFNIWPKLLPSFEKLERGGIIGSVEIVDCVTASSSPWFGGPYGFVLRRPIAMPFVQCRGALGFFTPEEVR